SHTSGPVRHRAAPVPRGAEVRGSLATSGVPRPLGFFFREHGRQERAKPGARKAKPPGRRSGGLTGRPPRGAPNFEASIVRTSANIDEEGKRMNAGLVRLLEPMATGRRLMHHGSAVVQRWSGGNDPRGNHAEGQGFGRASRPQKPGARGRRRYAAARSGRRFG